MLFRLSLTQKDNAKWLTLLCWRAFFSGKRRQSCWGKVQMWSTNQLHHQHHKFFEQHEATGKHYIERFIIKTNFANWFESNKRSRVQYRRHWQYPNKQSVLDYRYMQQIKHLHVLESTLSYSWLDEKNHHNQVRSFNWVRSRQNGIFRFVKTNGLCKNAFIPPKWDLTSTQVISHLGGMIFLHVNRFCRTVPPRRDCSFSLDAVCFYSY